MDAKYKAGTVMKFHKYVCPQCNRPFESRKNDRVYCSIACLAKGNKFNARENPKPLPGDTVPCLECKKPFYRKPYHIKRGKRFCSVPCYRKYMAGRFDRQIAAPVTFEAMQNFDEFLSQDKLECLVEGCNWVGDNLSEHMNLAHGVPAKEFKEAVGFNSSTAVMSAPMLKKLKAVERDGRDLTYVRKRGVDKAAKDRKPLTKEALEHFAKAGMLRRKYD